MRKIKFRAWHREAKEMFYPSRSHHALEWEYEGQPVDVMQYTGLKDRNGKEVYEGDVVKYYDDTWVVVWKNDGYVTRKLYDSWLKRIVFKEQKDSFLSSTIVLGAEIIGNIHENPELINQ